MKYRIIPVTDLKQNCSIVWCEISKEGILIDPGADAEKLYKAIDKLKVKIKKIVLTHGHIDHVGAANILKKHYNIPIVGPNKNDQFLLNDLFLQCYMLGFNMPSDLKIEPDIWLEDGDYIQVGIEFFNILHCPGHSPGHIVLWNKKCKFIFMGDVLFKNNIGRTDLPGGNMAALIKSIKTKLIPLGDSVKFLPGHGALSSIGYEKRYNPFLK